MGCDPLGSFNVSAVPQKLSNAGGAKGVATDFRLDAGVDRAAADHEIQVGLALLAASGGGKGTER